MGPSTDHCNCFLLAYFKYQDTIVDSYQLIITRYNVVYIPYQYLRLLVCSCVRDETKAKLLIVFPYRNGYCSISTGTILVLINHNIICQLLMET